MSSRRTFLKQAAAVSAGAANLRGQSGPGPAHPWREELPDMLLAYLSRKTNALAAEWDRRRAGIRTPTELEQRNAFVRAKCVEMLHGFPDRTPLQPVSVRLHQRDGYRIEVLMFQSRPDFWVTANLYLPEGKGPFPGIISPCGHIAEARLYPAYQFMYQGLVKEGFAVLAYDPIGQGERRYFWNPHTGRSEIGGPVTWEHSMPGQLLLLTGENLTQYRIWDGMRAIDYLLSRPEVDAQRIGCCGHSGGGTLTLYISALDERVKCAATHEGGTHRAWPMHFRPETWLGTGDVEQHFFPAAIYGIDNCDLHVAIAPRPHLTTIEQFNPSFDAAAREIQARYEQLGAAEKFAAVQALDPHDMTMTLRLANTDWFCRWFHGRPGPKTEPELRVESAADMNCTAAGSIRYCGPGDTIYSRLLRRQAKLPPENGPSVSELREQIRTLIRYRKYDGPPAARRNAVTPRRGYHIEKLDFISEPGIYVPAWVFVPDRRAADHSALISVSDEGKQAEGLEFGLLEALCLAGNLVIAVDVRGIGETRPANPDEGGFGQFRNLHDGENMIQFMAWEMNESLFGMRVQDVVRTVDYALSRSDVEGGSVRVIGTGAGALWLLFAAALDQRITRAVCERGLLSYRTLTSSDRYLHGTGIFIPGILNHFDLPQVAAAVAPRRLVILDPVDAMKSAVDRHTATRAYERAAQAWVEAGNADGFVVAGTREPGVTPEQYLSLLR